MASYNEFSQSVLGNNPDMRSERERFPPGKGIRLQKEPKRI